jgi:hypothetical protein
MSSNAPGFEPRRAAAVLGLVAACAGLVYVFYFSH